MQIPQNYEEWHHHINNMCEQELTLSFINARIEELNSPENYMTKRFTELYGEEQRLKTIKWFEQAKSTLK